MWLLSGCFVHPATFRQDVVGSASILPRGSKAFPARAGFRTLLPTAGTMPFNKEEEEKEREGEEMQLRRLTDA